MLCYCWPEFLVSSGEHVLSVHAGAVQFPWGPMCLILKLIESDFKPQEFGA